MSRIRSLSYLAFGLLLTAGLPASSFGAAPGDMDSDGVPDAAEALLGTDPKLADTDGDGVNDKDDQKPLEVADPIPAGGKSGGPVIRSVKVEDNYDPKIKRDAPDHLEIELRNPSQTEIRGLQVFVTIKDSKANVEESYARNLQGFSLKAGATRILHFEAKGSTDFAADTDRFRSNESSVLYKNPNSKAVTVKIAAPGFAPVVATVQKDEGAEVAD